MLQTKTWKLRLAGHKKPLLFCTSRCHEGCNQLFTLSTDGHLRTWDLDDKTSRKVELGFPDSCGKPEGMRAFFTACALTAPPPKPPAPPKSAAEEEKEKENTNSLNAVAGAALAQVGAAGEGGEAADSSKDDAGKRPNVGSGMHVVCGNNQGRIGEFTPEFGDFIREYIGHTGRITNIQVISDGKKQGFASASIDGTVRLWHRDSGSCLALLNISCPANFVAIWPTIPVKYAETGGDDGGASPGGSPGGPAGAANPAEEKLDPKMLFPGPKTELLGIACGDGKLRIVDVKSLKCAGAHDPGLPFLEDLTAALFFQKPKPPPEKELTKLVTQMTTAPAWLSVAGEGNADATDAQKTLSALGDAMSSVSPELFILVGSVSGKLSQVHAKTGNSKYVKWIQGHSDAVTGVISLPDPQRVATCGEDARMKIWDVQTMKKIEDIGGHESGCTEIV
eukprot:Cvel_26222.t1-p1 / transcript=Cvel_26222.t1 / gene=Cvel_26222 / organism=Chromera_velia_CCMP2878 / gene_product=hypothetical protein / transcript_product=hypothetical protein / location=Cvel_scaffold3091:328-5889(-) / protein_length=449 / sequence_SO=supercontig / SO=protein_coding / is_pseudo=false